MLNFSFQYYVVSVLQIAGLYCMKNDLPPMIIIAIVFSVFPLFDQNLKFDNVNPTPEEARKLQSQQRFKFPLYLSVMLDWIYLFYTLNLLLTQDLSVFRQAQILFLAGALGGSSINVSHELGHKIESNDYFEYYLAIITQGKSLYSYFTVEHNLGHHRNVATPGDPATSKKSQTVYAFYKQTLLGTIKSAWHIECEQLLKKNKTIKSVYHYKNKFFWYMALHLFMILFVYQKYQLKGTLYFLAIAILSVLFLETVNYIEHYGLVRNKLEDGTYEKVNHHHSWNAPHRLSNYLLFKLQRHSDHHENSTKPYQVLLSHESSPTLPNGYALMVVLALFPNSYFDIMNKCLDNYTETKGQKTDPKIQQENLQYIRKKTSLFLSKLTAGSLTLMIISFFI